MPKNIHQAEDVHFLNQITTQCRAEFVRLCGKAGDRKIDGEFESIVAARKGCAWADPVVYTRSLSYVTGIISWVEASPTLFQPCAG